MSEITKKILILGGPTASGKTKLAIKLAKENNGVLINVDSRQVYKYFDIGTNKGNLEVGDQKLIVDSWIIPQIYVEGEVEGWLFDFVEPAEIFTLNDFQQLAFKFIDRIIKQGKVPILVGGTGLYIDSIIKDYNISGAAPDHELRARLEQLDLAQLHQELKKFGFRLDNLNNSDKNNPYRLIRKIEKLNSQNDRDLVLRPRSRYNFDFYYPRFEREDLYQKINDRVIEMVKQGLVDEVCDLLEKGYRDTQPMKGIGYKEVVRFLDGDIKKDKMIELIQNSHRQYAKRQITWFEGSSRGYDLTRI